MTFPPGNLACLDPTSDRVGQVLLAVFCIAGRATPTKSIF